MTTMNIPEDTESSAASSSDEAGTSQVGLREVSNSLPAKPRPITIKHNVPLEMPLKEKILSRESSIDSEEDSSSSDEDSSPQTKQPCRPIIQPIKNNINPVIVKPQGHVDMKLKSYKTSDTGSSSDSDETPNLQPSKILANHPNVTVRKKVPAPLTFNESSVRPTINEQTESESDSDMSLDESNHVLRSNPLKSLPIVNRVPVHQPNSSYHALSDSDSSSDADNSPQPSKSNNRPNVTQSNANILNVKQVPNPVASRPSSSYTKAKEQTSSEDSSDSDSENSKHSQAKSNTQHTSSKPKHQETNLDSSRDDEGGRYHSTTSRSSGKRESKVLFAHPSTRSDNHSDDSSVEEAPRGPCIKSMLKSALPPEEYDVDKAQSVLYVEDLLSNDDEIWMVQTPKDMPKEVLMNQHLILDGTSKFSVPTDNGLLRYEAKSIRHDTPQNKTCILRSRATNQFQTVPLAATGQIIVTRSLAVLDIPVAHVAERRNIPMPQGLKLRHPFFGPDYEPFIHERNKSQDPPITFPKKTKKRKSNKSEMKVKNGVNVTRDIQVSSLSDNNETSGAGIVELENSKSRNKKSIKSKKDKEGEKDNDNSSPEGDGKNGYSQSTNALTLYNYIRRQSKTKVLGGDFGKPNETTSGDYNTYTMIQHSEKIYGNNVSGHSSRKKKSKADKSGNELSSFHCADSPIVNGLEDLDLQNVNSDLYGPQKHKKKKNRKSVEKDDTEYGSQSLVSSSFYKHVGLTFTSTPANLANTNRKRKFNDEEAEYVDEQSHSKKKHKKSKEFGLNSEERCESADLFNQLWKKQEGKSILQAPVIMSVSGKKTMKRSNDLISGEGCDGQEASEVKRRKVVSPLEYLQVEKVLALEEQSQNEHPDGRNKHKSKKKKSNDYSLENLLPSAYLKHSSVRGVDAEQSSDLHSGNKKEREKSDGLMGNVLQRPNLDGQPSVLDLLDNVLETFPLEHSHKKKKKKDKNRDVNVEQIGGSVPSKKSKHSKFKEPEVPVTVTQVLQTIDLGSGTLTKKKKSRKDKKETEDTLTSVAGHQDSGSHLSFTIPEVASQQKSKKNEQDTCDFDSDSSSVQKMFITQKFVEGKKKILGKIPGF